MRALCGSIITAGALIGLGLTALGWGVRFSGMNLPNPKTDAQIGVYSLGYLFAIIFAGMLIGLGIAFVGLMYHHERRLREHQVGQGATTRTIT